MKYRTLGRTGFIISEVGFGTWGIGGGWGRKDDVEADRALRRAQELGVNFFDTALVYGNGHSEQLLGWAVKGCREKVFIATKVPPKNYRWPVTADMPLKDTFPPDWIIQCAEKSLKNLRTEYIDLLQLHAWTDSYTRQMDWLDAFTRLKRQGKIRAFGVSSNDWDSQGPVSAVHAGLFDTVQVVYNIFEQRPAEQLLPAALRHQVGIIARVPFEEGLLTGAIQPGHKFPEGDWRTDWLTEERMAQVAPRLELLKGFLGPNRKTLSALALKFCLSHRAVSSVIPGMRKMRHVNANCLVSDGMPLSEEELKELSQHQFHHDWKYPWC